jgi:phosphonate degradation associated HDIG domain protein
MEKELMSPVDRIMDTLETAGGARYGMEAVSQLEHALQCATLAEEEGAGPPLIAAALLHDIGHLIHKLDDAAAQGIDDRHEALGDKLVRRWFRDEVARPVALHVDAKRYLCAVERAYFDHLSPASVRSLGLQGGRFTDDEAAAFIARDGAREAVRVRRWDDNAKMKGLKTPPLAHFRPYLVSCLRPSGLT